MTTAPRLLIVTGDDFGLSAPVNHAIVRAHRHGILTSASLMVNEPGFEEAVALTLETPSLAVGLHLALSRSRSTLPPADIPDLVDADGRFRDSPARAGWTYYWSRRAALQLEHELRAQIEKFLCAGLTLDHIDGHQHLHLHPTVFPILIRACADYHIPAVRIVRDPLLTNLRVRASRTMSNAASAFALSILGARARRWLLEYDVRAADRVLGLFQDGRMVGATLRALLSAAGDGVTELYLHPSMDDANGPSRHCRLEYEALVEPETLDAVRASGLRLTSYGALSAPD